MIKDEESPFFSYCYTPWRRVGSGCYLRFCSCFWGAWRPAVGLCGAQTWRCWSGHQGTLRSHHTSLWQVSLFSAVPFLLVFLSQTALFWGFLHIRSIQPSLCLTHTHTHVHAVLWPFGNGPFGNSVEQRKEHKKGLGAHPTLIICSWEQANQWTSPGPHSLLWKMEMVGLVWWNLKMVKQSTGTQEVFLKGTFRRSQEKDTNYTSYFPNLNFREN